MNDCLWLCVSTMALKLFLGGKKKKGKKGWISTVCEPGKLKKYIDTISLFLLSKTEDIV